MPRDKLQELVRDTVETLDYIMLHSVFIRGKQRNTLRITIYRKDTDISTKDCAQVSNVLSRRLDVEDLIPGAYNLIVESPGVEWKIGKPEEFSIFEGKRIKITVKEPEKYGLKNNVLIGVSRGFDTEKQLIELEQEQGKIFLEWKDVAKSHLYFDIKEYL